MALEIKAVPELKGKIASAFVKKANANVAKKLLVDFSAQVKSAKNILDKAQL